MRGRKDGMVKDGGREKGKEGSNNKPKRFAARYPWEEWFEIGLAPGGRRRGGLTIKRGIDFDCTLPGMTVNIRRAARIYGVRVRIDQYEDHLVLTMKR